MDKKISLKPKIKAYWQSWIQGRWWYGLTLVSASKIPTETIPSDWWPGDLSSGQSLIEGIFKLTDGTLPLKQFSHFLAVSSACPSFLVPIIHGFGWLRDLRMISSNASRKRARELIIYWIHYNHSWRQKAWLSAAWQAGVMGQRLRHWLAMYDFFGASADDSFRQVFFTSLNRQYKHLHRIYKLHNLSAWQQEQALLGLLFASCVLEKTPNHLKIYLKDYEKLIVERFTSQDMPMLRCPKIQFLLLQDLLDLRTLLRTKGYQEPSFLHQTIQSLTPLVRFFRHSNGELADFQGKLSPLDSQLIQAQNISVAAVDMVLSLSDIRARPIQNSLIGYERLSAKDGVVLLNTEASNPLPTLSDVGLGIFDFEWSIGALRFIRTSDLVLHTHEGHSISLGENPLLPHNDLLLKIKRQRQEGYHHLWAQLEKAGPAFHISLQREFYLAANLSDFRGCETINFDQDGVIGIRFVFDKTVQLLSHSNRAAMFKLNSPTGATSRLPDHQIWRLVSSGADQILTQSLGGGRFMVVLMSALQRGTAKTVKWAFHLNHRD